MKIKKPSLEPNLVKPSTPQPFSPVADPTRSTESSLPGPVDTQVQPDQLPRQNVVQAAEKGRAALSRLMRTLTGQTPSSRAVILGVVAAPAALTGVAHRVL